MRDEARTGSDGPNRSYATVCDCAEWLVYGTRVIKQVGYFMAYIVQKEGLGISVHTCKIGQNMTVFPQRIVIDSQNYIITVVSGRTAYRRPFTGSITTKKRVSDALLDPQEKYRPCSKDRPFCKCTVTS